MLKITAEEIHFIIYQYLHESGFQHSAFVFAQEANMHENRFNEYRIPSGMLIVFLEKALTLIHMETHLDDNEEIKLCKQPYSLLSPHTCDITVDQSRQLENMKELILGDEVQHQSTLPEQTNNRNNQTQMTQNFESTTNHNGMNYQHPSNAYLMNPHMSHMMQGIPPQHYATANAFNEQQTPQQNRFEQELKQQLPVQHQQNAQFQMNQTMAHLNNAYLYHGMHSIPAQMHYLDNLSQGSRLQSMMNNRQMTPGSDLLESDEERILIKSQNKGLVYFAQWSPKKRFLVTGGSSFMANLWDLQKDTLRGIVSKQLPHVRDEQSIEKASADVSSLQWNQAGDKFVTSSRDGAARVWNQYGNLESVKNFNMMLMVSKFNNNDGSLIATGGHSSKVVVWDVDNQKTNTEFTHSDNFMVMDLEWQNNHQLAVSGTGSNDIYLWSLERASEPEMVWKGHQQEITQIKWDPSGLLLASCSGENQALVWSPKQSAPIWKLKDHQSSINTIRWSNSSKQTGHDATPPLLATGCSNGLIKVWDVSKQVTNLTLNAHEKAGVRSLAFSPNNQMMASGGADDLVLWSLSDLTVVKHFEAPAQQRSEITELSWSHDGMYLAAAIHDSVAIFDIRKLSQTVSNTQMVQNQASQQS